MKNKDVVAEGEKLFKSFKAVDYDLQAQLKAIAAFEAKAVRRFPLLPLRNGMSGLHQRSEGAQGRAVERGALERSDFVRSTWTPTEQNSAKKGQLLSSVSSRTDSMSSPFVGYLRQGGRDQG